MSHWYDRDGVLHESVPNKSRPGETRPATLTDARAEGWFPSVTTVLDILDKPGIRAYRQEQMANAVMAEPWDTNEFWPEYLARMNSRADEHSEAAAQFGTEIHHVVAELYRGREVAPSTHGLLATPIGREVHRWMTANGFECVRPEFTFTNTKLGFSGTADWVGLLNGKPILLDLKSQEWAEGDKGRPFMYDEYPVQLAGYAVGLGIEDYDRYSLVVNRNFGVCDPVLKNWSKPTAKLPDPNRHYEQVWSALWTYWQWAKAYWPGEGER